MISVRMRMHKSHINKNFKTSPMFFKNIFLVKDIYHRKIAIVKNNVVYLRYYNLE